MATAPIYSLAEDHGRAEAIAWARFSTAKDRAEFCAGWLAILCTQIDRVSCGLLLLGPDQDGTYAPAAAWPDASRGMQHLAAAAERALKERRGVVMSPDGAAPTREQSAHIGYPIEVSGALHGAIVLDIMPSAEAALQRSLRLLHWGSAWLVDRFRQQALHERDERVSRLALAMDIVATALQQRHFATAALAVANELTSRLNCERVSIGIERSGSIEVKAISHTAVFEPKMNLVRLIADAMDEVLDLDVALVYPVQNDDGLGAIAHGELAREFRQDAVCSVPLRKDGHTIGVVTLERAAGVFDAATVELCKTVGELLGPILDLKRENERSIWQHARDAAREHLYALFGPRHPGAKLIALMLAGLLAFCGAVSGTYRISAKTVIEGAVQRAAVAPFDGHIAQGLVRAGDVVRAGQVLCRLDDRDLKLERTRLVSEHAQLTRKQRQALATQDRATMMIIAAQIEQTEAQLALTNERLARATLVAPFDGVVVSGDLSQLLDTPVEQGKVLFQIAPLDAYRVILQVDERDIEQIKRGQTGELTLSGLPYERMAFAVSQVTPVSNSQEGRNFFRVEAQLRDPSPSLRPGMEGVGKIPVGERQLIWIWTHSLVDWLWLWVWKELP
jgi:RND family efflux transporter MFP subunit